MTINYINTGTAPNQGNGDTLRLAFTKINANFNYLSTASFAPYPPFASTTTAGLVVIGDGLALNTLTGAISVTATPLPQPLDVTDSPTFNDLHLTDELFVGIPYQVNDPGTGINVSYNLDGYTQVMLQNIAGTTTSTSDLIIPRNDGDTFTNMIDLGMNSSNYIQPDFSLQTPGSGYLFTNGADLFIGTQTPGTKLVFHAGGTTTNDSGGTLDAYAWRFNRSVQVSVPAPGPLNFTVTNPSNDPAASAVYQAINDTGNILQLGVTSSQYSEGNIGNNNALIHTHEVNDTLHIGNKSAINFYADTNQGFNGTPTMTLINNDEYGVVFAGGIIPLNDSAQDLGTPTNQWRSLYLSTATIYMGGIPLTVNTTSNTLVLGGNTVGSTSSYIVGKIIPASGHRVTGVPMYSGAGNNLYVWLNEQLSDPNTQQVVAFGDLTGWVVSYADNSNPPATITSMAGEMYFYTDGPLAYVPSTTFIFTSPDYAVGYQDNVTVETNNHTWTFNSNGGLEFPNATTQTTAWTGGKVVSAPVSSAGASGDIAGSLAFDNSYIYYCKADYVKTGHRVTVDTLWDSSTSINTNQLKLTQTTATLQIAVGDTITDTNNATSVVGYVSSDGTYTYVGTGPGGSIAFNCQFPLTFTSSDYASSGNIWVRTAWSNDTW